MSTENQNSKNAVIIAVIGVVGVLGSALLANWDKVFPRSNSITPTISSTRLAPSSSPISSPSSSINPSLLQAPVQLEPLKEYLANKNWKNASLATDLLSPKSLSCSELSSINELWLKHSNYRFGYSVQRGIWEQNKLNGKYDDFAEFVGWKRDGMYAFNIDDPILNTDLDAPTKAPFGHLPFNGWQVKGVIREDFDAFMLKLAKCNV